MTRPWEKAPTSPEEDAVAGRPGAGRHACDAQATPLPCKRPSVDGVRSRMESFETVVIDAGRAGPAPGWRAGLRAEPDRHCPPIRMATHAVAQGAPE